MEGKELERKTLSVHKTLAEYKGQYIDKHMLWRGGEDDVRYPPTIYEEFTIEEYLSYQKLEAMCDKKQNMMSFKVSEQKKDIVSNLEDLVVGDKVFLEWNHDYIKVIVNGIESSFPVRVILSAEKRNI